MEIIQKNPLSIKLVAEWHPTKNLPLVPENVSAGTSGRSVWWLCAKKHEWATKPLHRTNGSGCPVCSGHKVLSGENDLATKFPQLMEEWDFTKNISVDPTKISSGVRTHVWWKCKFNHTWKSSIADRTKSGVNCLFCSDLKLWSGFNDLVTRNPALAAEWHPTKNGELKPENIKFNDSKIKVWWDGECGHEWHTQVSNRFNGANCHYCSNSKLLVGFNDLLTKNPLLASEWHPTKNGSLKVTDVSGTSGRKVWWLGVCGHVWEAQISNHSHGAGCSYCAHKLVIVGSTDLNSDSIKMSLWDFSKNLIIDPKTVFSSSPSQKFWWVCPICNYSWESSPNGVTNCGSCSGKHVTVGFNDLQTTHPDISSEWHPTKNGELKPINISRGHRTHIWWLGKCGHTYDAPPLARTSGGNCPYCAGYRVLVGFNDLAFKNPVLASEWHPTKNDDLLPTMVTVSSGKRIWWLGVCGHEWKALVSDRNYGSGCPQCANHVSQPELEIFEFLVGLGFVVEQSNRRVLGGLEIDLFLPAVNFGVEFNGVYWHDANHKSELYHYEKFAAANRVGVELVQVWEDDWRFRSVAVKRALAVRLGCLAEFNVLFPEFAVDASEVLKVVSVSAADAEPFLGVHHVDGFEAGTITLGLESSDGRLVSVLVMDSSVRGFLRLVRFAALGDPVTSFKLLFDYLLDGVNPVTVVAVSDNCLPDAALFEGYGFVKGLKVAPGAKFVLNGRRLPLNEFVEGSPLIWDAGGVEYVFTVI